MIKTKKNETRKLTLTRETVRKLAVTLSDEQLRGVAGGLMKAGGTSEAGCGSVSTNAPC